jgi:hypothetical protein
MASSFEDLLEFPEEQTSYDRPCFSPMIVSCFVANLYGFCTGAYAPEFYPQLVECRIATVEIAKTPEGGRFTPESEATLLHRLAIVTGIPEAGAS